MFTRASLPIYCIQYNFARERARLLGKSRATIEYLLHARCFARTTQSTHLAYVAVGQARRATIGYLVYKGILYTSTHELKTSNIYIGIHHRSSLRVFITKSKLCLALTSARFCVYAKCIWLDENCALLIINFI